jgi:NTE family protein
MDVISSFERSSVNTHSSYQKIGLALGGGAVLGSAHVGVLKAIEAYELPLHCIAGTSIGAVAAALYAFGKTVAEIEEIARDLQWMDISSMSLSQFALLSNAKLGEMLTDILGDVDVSRASIPLAIVAADICTGEKVILRKGGVATAVMASTCIPGVFIPVQLDPHLLVDGGIVENVPLSALLDMGAELLIGVDLNAGHTYKKPENIVDVLLNTFDIVLNNATALQTEDADVLITPDLSEFNLIDTSQTEALIEKGYQETMAVLRKYFTAS